MRDLANSLAVRTAIAPAAAVSDNTAIIGAIVDRNGFEGLAFALVIGQIADADATFAVLVQHGDQPNLSDAADVPDASLTGTETAAGFKFDSDGQTRKIGYVGSKRYVRLTVTPANNAGAAFVSAAAIMGHSRYFPAV